MKITITPGVRNEELIAEIKTIHSASTEEEWAEYVGENAASHNEEWFDALYYANQQNNAGALEEQAWYFQEILFDDECMFFAERLAKVSLNC